MVQRERIRLPMQKTEEMQVRFLGWEVLLEEEIETHSSILAWRVPWTEKSGGATARSVAKSPPQLSY